MLELLPAPLRDAASGEHVVPVTEPADPGEIDVQGDEGLISLTVRDGSLRHVVAQIADTQNLNIVFAASADKRVTASFERLPWQQALDALLAASGFVWTDNQGVIFVTGAENASQVAPRAGGRRVQVFELNFMMAVDAEAAIQGLLSPAGNAWIVSSDSEQNLQTREMVAVVDYPANLEQVSEYLSQADQPPRQVMIEAHILQVDLDESCRNGINWANIASFAGNQVGFGFVSPGLSSPGNLFATSGGGSAGDSGSDGDGSSGSSTPGTGSTLVFGGNGTNSTSFIAVNGGALHGLVDFLQETMDAKALASPRLLAVSGQTAMIHMGGEIGYKLATSNQGVTQDSVEFLEVGTKLTITPRITREGRVLLKLTPEVSAGELNSEGVPNTTTTKLETDILLDNGCGVVIGGLIQETDSIVSSKIPFLGDIPYAGLLFQRREQQKVRKELVVTLIPHVVPYGAELAEREADQYFRASQPLTQGAIHRFPRPYEPRLPDTLTNPRPICPACWARPGYCEEHAAPAGVTRLPPVVEPFHQQWNAEPASPVDGPREALHQPTSVR